MKTIIKLLLLGQIVFTSCSFRRENDKDDIRKAVAFTENYLRSLKISPDSAFPLVIDVPKQDFLWFCNRADSTNGKILSYSYREGQSNVVSKGGTTTGEYIIKFNLEREKKKITCIVFLTQNDDKLTITKVDEKYDI